ncbi:uncharacterized protein LOC129784444 [Falco peregrinus]|uniref:uncharacterized protein LOC129784438 n=1 Tax=Falco peregrinus TaxID=8954 RepID=UPI00247979AD|nr:uncharacterized protein LOC129784438 [Falco peregrinus]XP_055659705.1 uncharacterized protein LOC129784440 [Falco peregrinus]XP_055659718.1 uncharacterized protein LOC129784444 [Falco peregrinus]
MRRGRGAGLAGLAALLLVAVGRAQVQQEPSAETTEDTGIAISCSHPSIRTEESIVWYRQLPGRGPAFITSGHKGSREVQDPPGRMSVAADRRSSALWLARPRRRDAAVYYCAVGDTGLGAGAAAGHEPRRPAPEMTIQRGHSTALRCNFSTSSASSYIFWYQQRQTQSPQMLLQGVLFDDEKRSRKHRRVDVFKALPDIEPVHISSLCVEDNAKLENIPFAAATQRIPMVRVR